MTQRQSYLAMAAILLLVVGLKLSQQLYRFYSHREERVEIARLEGEIEEAGYGMIVTQLRADTLRQVIDSLDRDLREIREQLDDVERRLAEGSGISIVELSYRQRIDSFNRRVRERNEQYARWRAAADSNSVHVFRYGVLFDSIRAMATALGEPHYPIPTPAEIVAGRRGDSE